MPTRAEIFTYEEPTIPAYGEFDESYSFGEPIEKKTEEPEKEIEAEDSPEDKAEATLEDNPSEQIKNLVLEKKGGLEEEWEKDSYDGRNEHFFNGVELLDKDGNSLTKLIEKECPQDQIENHHRLLEHFRQNPTEPYLHPADWEIQTPEGKILKVTVATIDTEGNVSYETWNHKIEIVETIKDKAEEEPSESQGEEQESMSEEGESFPLQDIEEQEILVSGEDQITQENEDIEVKLTEFFAETLSVVPVSESRSIADLLASVFVYAPDGAESPLENQPKTATSTEVVMKSVTDTYEQEKAVSTAPMRRTEAEVMKIETVIDSNPGTGPTASPEKAGAPVESVSTEELRTEEFKEEGVELPAVSNESVPEFVLEISEAEQVENISSEVTSAAEMKESPENMDSIIVEVEDQINLEGIEIKSESTQNAEQPSEKDSPEESSGIKIVKIEAEEIREQEGMSERPSASADVAPEQKMSSEVRTVYAEPAPSLLSEKLEQDARIRSSEIVRMIGMSLRETEKTSQFQNQTPEILRRGQQYTRSYFIDESEMRSAANDNQDLRIMNVSSRDGITMRIAA